MYNFVVVWQWFKQVYNSRAVGTQSSAVSSVAAASLHGTTTESLSDSSLCRLSQDCTRWPAQVTCCTRRPAVHSMSTWSRRQTATSLESRNGWNTQPATHQVQWMLSLPWEGFTFSAVFITVILVWNKLHCSMMMLHATYFFSRLLCLLKEHVIFRQWTDT